VRVEPVVFVALYRSKTRRVLSDLQVRGVVHAAL
jgi:hypothetical protein